MKWNLNQVGHWIQESCWASYQTTRAFFYSFFEWIKKALVALQIIFYIIKYYCEKTIYYHWLHFGDEVLWSEIKSFFFILSFAFFFYYFVVIDLSIRIFGYSFLCYWFLFIFVTICILFAWWLEAEFLKTEMDALVPHQLHLWLIYYNGENPLSLLDFLTYYYRRPAFWFLVLSHHAEDVYEGWVLLGAFFGFLIFFFFYACSYWYDPWFVKFVSIYFRPAINFFDSWYMPRLEDLISAPVWFWVRLLWFIWWKKYLSKEKISLIAWLTYPGQWLSNWGNAQRAYKISLWKVSRFADIYFLWALTNSRSIWKIVFRQDQPIVQDIWFDPNWNLFFLWYMTQQYNSFTDNFWKKYFTNDTYFWWFLNALRQDINKTNAIVDQDIKMSYTKRGFFTENIYEYLFSTNYLNATPIDFEPLREWFGVNWDYYWLLVDFSARKKYWSGNNLWRVFGMTALHSNPQTITGLWNFHWKNVQPKISRWDKFWKNFPIYQQVGKIIFSEILDGNFSELKEILEYNLAVPLYWHQVVEQFPQLPLEQLAKVLTKPIPVKLLADLYHLYNYWLTSLENSLGIISNEWSLNRDWHRYCITFDFIATSVLWRVNRIENILENKGFEDYFSNAQFPFPDEMKYIYYWYLWWWDLLDTIWHKIIDPFYERPKKPSNSLFQEVVVAPPKPVEKIDLKTLPNPIYWLSADKFQIFVDVEGWLWQLEKTAGLRQADVFPTSVPEQTSDFPALPRQPWFADFPFLYQQPWFITSLRYFGTRDWSFLLPGFIWYYSPTPYPMAFSTFGGLWNKYQFYRHNTLSTVVGWSDNIMNVKWSVAMPMYTSVEAIVYFKPLLDAFDWLVKFIIKCLSYPIEFLINFDWLPPLTTATSLAFFAHFVWFIHFYLYVFVFLYLLYYFLIYYFWKVGFVWFYEWMFEELTVINYNSWVFWHTPHNLWVNYKTPDQLLILALQTNVLLYYSFFEYINFSFVHRRQLSSIIWILVNLYPLEPMLWNSIVFAKYFDFSAKTNFNPSPFFAFSSFFTTYVSWFSALLFSGGSQCSPEHLLWGYLDYLNQTSHFLSRALWWNYYKISQPNTLTALLRQLTLLFSANSPDNDFLFLIQPVLDSVLAWKLFLNFFFFFKWFSKSVATQELFYSFSTNKLIFTYISLIGYQRDFFLFNTISALDVYKLFDLGWFHFMTKRTTTTFWNDQRYWILVFFRSCRFIPKIWYPGVNLHLAYEDSWLHLSRVAYANSWIGQSTYVKPFFNLVQHLWWTSKIYSQTTSFINSPLDLNKAGIGVIDNFRNFFEKRYEYACLPKTETIFGLIRGLTIQTHYYTKNQGWLPSATNNLDLSFHHSLLDKQTTEWPYLKTNPALDLFELGITPITLLKLFITFWFPPIYLKFYFTFLTQLALLDREFKFLFQHLETEFLEKLTVFDGVIYPDDHDIYSQYEYYYKKFDQLLNFNCDKILKNWMFGFDVSFFFSHFTTWDTFDPNLHKLRPTNLSIQPNQWPMDKLNLFFTNLDSLATMRAENNWFNKPFGVLDKTELQSMKKFKNLKALDIYSFSWHRQDPFLLLDWEHTSEQIGYMTYPQSDPKTLGEAYHEEFSGVWDGWFPTNPAMIKNKSSVLVVGWVGTVWHFSLLATNFLYSLTYASPTPHPNACLIDWPLTEVELVLGAQSFLVQSVFGPIEFYQWLYVQAFSWLNLLVHPSISWYAYGQKAGAWFDYWSWKCGLTIDYCHGFYTYWPYMGFWHAFGTRLNSFDSLYGLYRSYRQIDDNPLVVDMTTYAVDHFAPVDEALFVEWMLDPTIDALWDDASNFDERFLKELSVPYREVYYSFQHPYFVGYLVSWLLLLTAQIFYLGIVNFSITWFLLWDFTTWNNLLDEINEDSFDYKSSWTLVENRYWKQMFWYRWYYTNPTRLMVSVDCSLDDDVYEWGSFLDSMHQFYWLNSYLTKYFIEYFKFSTEAFMFLISFWTIFTFSALINWLVLDIPFSFMPHLLINYSKLNLYQNQLVSLWWTHQLAFSHPDSLREIINFNMCYDWSNGVFFDSLNLTSYISAYRGTVLLQDVFFDNPNYIASHFTKYHLEMSEKISWTIFSEFRPFTYQDMNLSHGLALHNAALVDFLSETIDFYIGFKNTFAWWFTSFKQLRFYLSTHYFKDYSNFWWTDVIEIDSKIITNVASLTREVKQTIMFWWLHKTISYELLLAWFYTGTLFANQEVLKRVLKALWFWLFTRYQQMERFYRWIGLLLYFYFFWK